MTKYTFQDRVQPYQIIYVVDTGVINTTYADSRMSITNTEWAYGLLAVVSWAQSEDEARGIGLRRLREIYPNARSINITVGTFPDEALNVLTAYRESKISS